MGQILGKIQCLSGEVLVAINIPPVVHTDIAKMGYFYMSIDKIKLLGGLARVNKNLQKITD